MRTEDVDESGWEKRLGKIVDTGREKANGEDKDRRN